MSPAGRPASPTPAIDTPSHDAATARLRPAVVLCLALACLLPCPSRASQLPLWEVGVGVGAIHLPDYRGASHASNYVLPFPYFVYRGKALKVDRSQIHGRIFGTDRILLDLSLAGGVPVSSRNNAVRRGMPNLAPTAELGPSLDIRLWAARDNSRSLWLRLPVRAVFSVSLSEVTDQGWVFAPYLQYKLFAERVAHPLSVTLSFGPLFADERFHNYYYGVAPAFATATRPSYRPGGGYSGSRVTVTLQKRLSRFWFGMFARYDTLSGAAFADSPLVTHPSYLALGLGVTWVFAESKTRVPQE